MEIIRKYILAFVAACSLLPDISAQDTSQLTNDIRKKVITVSRQTFGLEFAQGATGSLGCNVCVHSSVTDFSLASNAVVSRFGNEASGTINASAGLSHGSAWMSVTKVVFPQISNVTEFSAGFSLKQYDCSFLLALEKGRLSFTGFTLRRFF